MDDKQMTAVGYYLNLAAQYNIPDYMREGLAMYIVLHVKSGDFLMSVLRSDLRGAAQRADMTNRRLLWDYCNFLYNCAPTSCWGSNEAVDLWLSNKEG